MSKLSSKDQKFYKEAWEANVPFCEECGKHLPQYSAVFISHILSKGSHPEYRWALLNVNILCFDHHQQWEFGDRSKMNIYEKNLLRIEKLKTR